MFERSGPCRSALAAVALLLLQAAPALGDTRAEARLHFQSGMSLIRDGKYEEGTSELYEAYRILPHPSVLYNIGRAFFDAGKYERAIEEFERYLESDPADRAEVTRMVDVARARVRDEERAQRTAEPASLRPGETPPDADEAARAGRSKDVNQELTILRRQLQQMLDRVDTLQGSGESSPDAGLADRDGSSRDADGTARSARGGAERLAATPGEVAGEGIVTDRSDEGAPRDDPYAPVVVTSSRYGQSPLDAPNSVTILTGEELRASGVTSIPDFLRRVPGIEVMAMSPGDYNIGIRGFNDRLANKVLVLVDGRSVYLDNIGATLWPFLHISPSDVERIEIVRGPGAALYGANAFSGVINIITRSPGLPNDEPVAEMWGGFPDQGGASLRLSDRVGSTAYRASFAIERKRRWYREVDPARPEYELLPSHPDDSVRVGRFDLRLDHRLGRRSSVSLSGGVSGGQSEFVAIGSLRDFYVDGYQSYIRGDLMLPHGFSLRSFWTHTNFTANQWARPVGALDIETRPVTDVVDVEAESFREVDFGVVQRLNVGAGYRFKSARWNWLGSEPKEHHVSVFFQDEAILADSLHAIFSLRLDRHPLLVAIDNAAFTDRYAFSPRGALVWRVAPGHSVHATIGTAFRTPTFLESYIATPIPTTTDAVVVRNAGNLNLLPERVLATEVGWRSEPASSRYQLEGAAYFNRISSLIQLSELQPWPAGMSNYDPAAGVWYAGDTTYINAGEDYDALGFELGGKVFPAEGLDLYGNGTVEKIDQGGTSIESTSPVKLSAGAQVRGQNFTIAGDLHLVTSQTWGVRSYNDDGTIRVDYVDLPSYVWAGARLSYLIPDSRLELAIAGQNLLAPLQSAVTPAAGDMQVTTPKAAHREHPLGQPVPASVFATLTYRLW